MIYHVDITLPKVTGQPRFGPVIGTIVEIPLKNGQFQESTEGLLSRVKAAVMSNFANEWDSQFNHVPAGMVNPSISAEFGAAKRFIQERNFTLADIKPCDDNCSLSDLPFPGYPFQART